MSTGGNGKDWDFQTFRFGGGAMFDRKPAPAAMEAAPAIAPPSQSILAFFPRENFKILRIGSGSFQHFKPVLSCSGPNLVQLELCRRKSSST